MNKNILYGLVFTVLFFGLILPDLLDPSKGLIFTLEEWTVLLFFLLAVVFFRKRVEKIIHRLEQSYPWATALPRRFFTQLGIILAATAIVAAVVLLPLAYYLTQHGIPPFYQEILDKKIKLNALDDQPEDWERKPIRAWTLTDFMRIVAEAIFYCVLLIFVVEEVFAYLTRQAQKKLEIATILKEQAQLKASVLSKQLDPHFMFNTLNVLSGLIYQDVDKSAQFIKELAKVYRYVLEQSEELVSTVEQEFQFLESYMYLLKIRFDDKIPLTIDISPQRKDWFLPSMTLELLVENAIKHNVVDQERPLHLNFCVKDEQLIVKNNLQPRSDVTDSLGLGLSNLKKRLALLDKKNYSFTVKNDEFVAIVPLINPTDV
ncbi:MAG: sensor histidine kinase [Saprospiraceae bacterium]